jgi:hypothetical protein
MRALLLLVFVVACGDDNGRVPLQLSITFPGARFHATSDVGIDCGGTAVACEVTLPYVTDVVVTIRNMSPQLCHLWKATVTPRESGLCTVVGTTGTCNLLVDRPVTVNVGNCVNP